MLEVIVVAAEGHDKTQAIVKSKMKQFTRITLLEPGPRVGKGRDVKYGIQRSSGALVMFMDADLATPLVHLREFYELCTHGNDIVIGTRDLRIYRSSSIRRIVSFFGNVLFKLCGGIWIEDSQCGFKMFTKAAAELCFSEQQIVGWTFDMELLTIAKTNHLKVATRRINDWRDVPDSTFADGVVVTAFNSLKDLSHILKNRLTGKYTSEKHT